MSGEQLALDIEGMLHEARVQSTPEWSGAPLHFTTDYYSPGDLDAAFEHWQFLHAHDPVHSGSRTVEPLDRRTRERTGWRARGRALHGRPSLRAVEARRQAPGLHVRR